MMSPSSRDTLLCAHCHTRNAPEAVLCHFCGETMEPEESVHEAPGRESLIPPDDPFGTKDPVLEGVRGLHRSVFSWMRRDDGVPGAAVLGCGLSAVLLFFAPWIIFIVLLIAYFVVAFLI